MKILWLMGSAYIIVACGSSGNGTASYNGSQTQPAPTNASQMPQVPADSIPATNDQQPPINSQQPSGGSQSPSLTSTASITCAQAYAILRAAGCNVTQNDQAQCEAAAAPAAACSTEVQALFRCYMNYVACDDSGHLLDAATCNDELTAVDNCERSHVQPPPPNPGGCTAANSCNCASDCASCRCAAIATPSLTSTCDAICSATN